MNMFSTVGLLAAMLICGLQCVAMETTPGHRAKRSDDHAPLEAVVMHLTEEMNQMKTQMTADKTLLTALQNRVNTLERRVAFLVQISTDRGRVMPARSPFRFDQVVLNDGNAYNRVLGVFTAPYSGVYILAVQAFTDKGENPLVDIRVNDLILTRMSVDTRNLGDHEESTSSAVVAKLDAGDKVWVEADEDWTFFGDHHSFFTGALLYST